MHKIFEESTLQLCSLWPDHFNKFLLDSKKMNCAIGIIFVLRVIKWNAQFRNSLNWIAKFWINTFGFSQWRWKNPWTNVKISIANAEQIRFKDTADNPYFFKNVIRNPKPMKIMTWTSWNTKKRKNKTKVININWCLHG